MAKIRYRKSNKKINRFQNVYITKDGKATNKKPYKDVPILGTFVKETERNKK